MKHVTLKRRGSCEGEVRVFKNDGIIYRGDYRILTTLSRLPAANAVWDLPTIQEGLRRAGVYKIIDIIT
jgi:hypothetical protein